MAKAKKKAITKHTPLKLDMTFEQAIKKAMVTPVPKKKRKKK